MTAITYDEWSERFEVTDLNAADADSEISDNPEDFTFYDNGAVRGQQGDFVIKCEQVKKLQ